MSNGSNNPDPIPVVAYPTLQPVTSAPPVLPQGWECLAVLHPFSPLQSNSTPTDEASPFFELCVASIVFQANEFLSAQITGISGRMWWYVVAPDGTTFLSTSGDPNTPPSNPGNQVDVGWSLPGTNWLGNNASC